MVAPVEQVLLATLLELQSLTAPVVAVAHGMQVVAAVEQLAAEQVEVQVLQEALALLTLDLVAVAVEMVVRLEVRAALELLF